MSAPLVRTEVLTKRYGGRTPVTAVVGVSLAVQRAETLALVGESGSGKTTLGRCLLYLVKPSAGRVVYNGHDVGSLAPAALRALRRRMQIVFQDPAAALNPRLRVGDAIREPVEVHGLARGRGVDERVAALAEEVGLLPQHLSSFPVGLSGGQRQRAVIARALAVEPEFVVLDEPVSNLDVSIAAQVLSMLLDLQARRGLTYLFITHDLAVVRQVAHRVAVMYAGRIVELAPAPALFQQALHPYTSTLLAAVPVPEPGRRRVRLSVAGEPPGAGTPPAGCPFHPRCPHPRKDARCRAERPALREVQPERWAACHYAEAPVSLRSE